MSLPLETTDISMEVDVHAPRRSTRGKGVVQTQAHVAPEPAPPPIPRVPRRVNYEIVRAPPELVAAYNAARTEYHDAVIAWWWRKPKRAREEHPTEEDRAAVRLDPWVRAAGERLDKLDADLTRLGVWVKSGTVANDSRAPAKVRAEARKSDIEYYAQAHKREEEKSYDGKPTKRKRAADGASASASGSTASTSSPLPTLTPITSPEPDHAPAAGECEFKFELSEHPKFAIKRQWQNSRKDNAYD